LRCWQRRPALFPRAAGLLSARGGLRFLQQRVGVREQAVVERGEDATAHHHRRLLLAAQLVVAAQDRVELAVWPALEVVQPALLLEQGQAHAQLVGGLPHGQVVARDELHEREEQGRVGRGPAGVARRRGKDLISRRRSAAAVGPSGGGRARGRRARHGRLRQYWQLWHLQSWRARSRRGQPGDLDRSYRRSGSAIQCREQLSDDCQLTVRLSRD